MYRLLVAALIVLNSVHFSHQAAGASTVALKSSPAITATSLTLECTSTNSEATGSFSYVWYWCDYSSTGDCTASSPGSTPVTGETTNELARSSLTPGTAYVGKCIATKNSVADTTFAPAKVCTPPDAITASSVTPSESGGTITLPYASLAVGSGNFDKWVVSSIVAAGSPVSNAAIDTQKLKTEDITITGLTPDTTAYTIGIKAVLSATASSAVTAPNVADASCTSDSLSAETTLTIGGATTAAPTGAGGGSSGGGTTADSASGAENIKGVAMMTLAAATAVAAKAFL